MKPRSPNISWSIIALVAAAVTTGAAVVHAQQPSGPPNALQGFSQNRDKPIRINAASLDVHDKEKTATFAGDVHLVQGDVDMRSATLVVFYDDQPPPPAPPPKGGKASGASAQIPPPQQQQENQQIKRVEAKGGVTVRVPQKDQTATGDQGVFDMRANTVTMLGHVIIAQGPNVLRADTLVVDMNSGATTLKCDGKGGCRVQALITPGSEKQFAPPASPGAAAPAGAARPTTPPRRSSQSQPCGKDGLNSVNCTANP